MPDHAPNCAIFGEPPTLRDPSDCDCGAVPRWAEGPDAKDRWRPFADRELHVVHAALMDHAPDKLPAHGMAAEITVEANRRGPDRAEAILDPPPPKAILPCDECANPACALVAGRWYCLAHLRDLAQRALERTDAVARDLVNTSETIRIRMEAQNWRAMEGTTISGWRARIDGAAERLRPGVISEEHDR